MRAQEGLILGEVLGGAGDQRPDDWQFTVAAEGGGMRGVYGAGVLAALSEAGHTPLVTRMTTVSASAPNAYYFVAGQPEFGVSRRS